MPVIVLVIVPVALVAFVLIMWRAQERIVFQPPRPPGDAPPGSITVEYTASDAQPLRAYVIGNPGESTRLLIAFHGNAEEAHWELAWAREVNRVTGWPVMLPEYRGYAGLPGSPTYENEKLDARAAYRAGRQLLPGGVTQIAYYGHSLGSAIAAELAVEFPPSVLVMESPLSSARDMARIVVVPPIFAVWRLISRVHYNTVAIVGNLDVPVWVAHGKRDMITPVSMGRRVHAAALTKGDLLIVDRASHNDVAQHAGDTYWKWISAALG